MSEKAIFLDRDDTLIDDPGYINDPDQVKLLDGVSEALIQLKALGYKLIVVTNQSAVAHGIVTEKVLGEIHERLKQLLADKNAFLDRIYYCPYHPEGVVPKYSKESNSRKPSPGMLLKAADEMDIDLGQSWCVGNSSRDVEAGLRAGCKTILIDLPPSHQKQSASSMSLAGVNPDYKAVNIKEAVNIVKKHLRSSAEKQNEALEISTSQNEPASQDAEQVSEVAESPEQIEVQQIAPEPQEPETLQKEPSQQPPEPPIQTLEPQIPPSAESQIPADKTEELLSGILGQLKSMQRAQMFGEFSIMRLMAGILQIVVLFCLLVTVWFLMSPDRQDNLVFIALGFAIVFQLMTLTFYIMQGKK
ncbi:D-glycero-alpha-D-manno-heptose-1,7-bisphosphate 7-phosphatase [Planctomycetota bacterium]